MKHSRLAEDVEKAMTTVQVQQRLADNGNVESCYTPIIQSGGNFSLKLSAERFEFFSSQMFYLLPNYLRFRVHID